MADVATVDVLAGDANLVPERWIGLDTPDPAAVVGEYRDAVARIHETGRAAGSADLRQFQATSSGTRDDDPRPRESTESSRSEQAGRRASWRTLIRAGSTAATSCMAVLARSARPRSQSLRATSRLPATSLSPRSVSSLSPSTSSVGTPSAPASSGLRVAGHQLRSDYLAAVVDGKWNKRFFTGATIQRLHGQGSRDPDPHAGRPGGIRSGRRRSPQHPQLGRAADRLPPRRRSRASPRSHDSAPTWVPATNDSLSQPPDARQCLRQNDIHR